MRESSAIQSLADYAAPQLRKRIPVTGTNWPTAKARYQRVLGQLAALRHDNVEAVHEVHFDPPKDCYLVCERLEGDALSEVIARERRLPLETVRSITRQIANALTAAHHQGVMHGNLSPQAIVVQRPEPGAGEDSLRIKVCDFGLGKALGPELFGALGYLAPEQVDPKEPRPEPTPLSDQFALAVIAFELLAGRRAFSGETLEEITPKLLRQDPIHFQIPGISRKESARIIAGLHKALSRLPSERYVSLAEFVAALESRPQNNNRSRGSVLDPTRFAAEHRAPLKIEASMAQALAVAARQFPGPLEPARPGQDVPTLTMVHLGGPQGAHQAATQPMMPRLEFQFNVQTTVANRNDSHLNIVMPQPPSGKHARHPDMRMRRYLLAALIGAAIAIGVLLLSLHPFFAGRLRETRLETIHETPPILVTEPDQPPEPKDIPSTPTMPLPPPKTEVRRKPPSKPKRPKFALQCTPTHKIGTVLSQNISACSNTLSENSRGTVLVLPLSPEGGHPKLSMNDAPQGPADLINCLRNLVASSRKAELGTLPRTGLVLHCSIQ